MIKARISRQVYKKTVAAEAKERVLTVLKESSNVEDTESSSTEIRAARRAAAREATWLAWVEKVRAGQLTPRRCKHQLEKFKIKVQVKHVELAVNQRNRDAEPTKLKDLRETRGRKPLLSEANEESLAEHVRNLVDARVWFSWTLISREADHLWRVQEGEPAEGDDERSFSNRCTYRWYVKFLERHYLRITKLSTFDDKRVNSATPSAIHSHFHELYALLESHDMIRKKGGCVFDPKAPFASQYEWNPEKMNRFVTGDETSCHLDITDGLGRFRFVSRGDQKPEEISVPIVQLSCFHPRWAQGRRRSVRADDSCKRRRFQIQIGSDSNKHFFG